MVDGTESDQKKFAYHEGARIIRTVQDRICEITHTGALPTEDQREALCDMLIELHQLLYGVTLHTLRSDDPGDDEGYEDDEIYSNGRPVITRLLFEVDPTDDPIPPEAYRGDIGEDVPPGGVIYVWRPDDSNYTGLATDDDAVVVGVGDFGTPWKAFADLRASGLIEWARADDGHFVKRRDANGRLGAACRITAVGLARVDRLMGMPSDSPDARGGPVDNSQIW
jgi:hypothetical protein